MEKLSNSNLDVYYSLRASPRWKVLVSPWIKELFHSQPVISLIHEYFNSHLSVLYPFSFIFSDQNISVLNLSVVIVVAIHPAHPLHERNVFLKVLVTRKTYKARIVKFQLYEKSLLFFSPSENVSLIWRRLHFRWMTANSDLCSVFTAENMFYLISLRMQWHFTLFSVQCFHCPTIPEFTHWNRSFSQFNTCTLF